MHVEIMRLRPRMCLKLIETCSRGNNPPRQAGRIWAKINVDSTVQAEYTSKYFLFYFCVFPFQLPDGQRFPPTRWQRGLLVWRAWNRDTQSEAVRPVATATWASLCKNVNKFTGIRIQGSNYLSRPITSRRGVPLPPIFNLPKSLAPGLSPPLRPRARRVHIVGEPIYLAR